VIKEGTVYRMRVYFKVRNECVYGLKFINNIYKMNFIKGNKPSINNFIIILTDNFTFFTFFGLLNFIYYLVDKYEEMMGSFAPKEEE
jgi:hypothetical protein